MRFITFCEGEPLFEILPAFKAGYYSGEYKPYFQARAAVSRELGICLDLTSFIRTPSVGSCCLTKDDCVAFALEVCPKKGGMLTGVFNAEGKSCFTGIGGVVAYGISEEISARVYSGDDEQGWYFGVRCIISPETITKACGCFPRYGDIIRANFYTLKTDGYFGSVLPIRETSVESRANTGEFVIGGISYPPSD